MSEAAFIQFAATLFARGGGGAGIGIIVLLILVGAIGYAIAAGKKTPSSSPVTAAPSAGPSNPDRLRACPDCGRFISKLAPACIQCGRPFDKQSNA
jgi:hypothetical protein